jgi:hypothetical protein
MQIVMDTNLMLAGYLGLCILLTVIVHSFSIFDRRALATELDDELNPLSFFERPDRGLLILFFGALGLIVAAYVGWRVPAEIQQFMGRGEAVASDIASGPLARAAQVVGAICFLLIALRLLRLSLILTFALSVMALAVAAYAYVFNAGL